MGKKKTAQKQRSLSEFFKGKMQFLKTGKKTASAEHSPQYKNLEDFILPKTNRPKDITPIIPVKSQEFNGITLCRTEAQSMMALERLFGQKIPLITDPSKSYSMAFMAKDQHVVELYLTKYSLRGFIQITVFPEEICNLPQLRILELKLTQIVKLSDTLGNLI